MRGELSDWQLWWGRALVVSLAGAAGLTVVGFTWLSERAFGLFEDVRGMAWWSPLIWTPLCTAAIVWLTRRFAPGAAGSGIPQVMAALDPALAPEHRGLFVSLRLSVAKIALTASGLLAGLSLGREGPSVQIAAGIMLQARRWLPAALVGDDPRFAGGGRCGGYCGGVQYAAGGCHVRHRGTGALAGAA